MSDTLIYLPSLRLLSDISSFAVLNSMLLYSMLLDWLQTADMSQHLAHMLTRLLWLKLSSNHFCHAVQHCMSFGVLQLPDRQQ